MLRKHTPITSTTSNNNNNHKTQYFWWCSPSRPWTRYSWCWSPMWSLPHSWPSKFVYFTQRIFGKQNAAYLGARGFFFFYLYKHIQAQHLWTHALAVDYSVVCSLLLCPAIIKLRINKRVESVFMTDLLTRSVKKKEGGQPHRSKPSSIWLQW